MRGAVSDGRPYRDPTDGTHPFAAVRLARLPSALWDFHSYVARPRLHWVRDIEVELPVHAESSSVGAHDLILGRQPIRAKINIDMYSP